MTKSIEESFRDWEGFVFGFGYGSGEPHVIPAVRQFFALVDDDGRYDYQMLEADLTPAVAWLLINTFAKHRVDIIEYGTSPRYGWLNPHGKRLREFMLSKTDDELIDIATRRNENDTVCEPDCCNCGPAGYVRGKICENPFWRGLK